MEKIKHFNQFLLEYMTPEGRWGNVGAGILPYCPSTKRYLIPLRSDDVLEPNTWGIWGGKIEDHDNGIEKTAIREFREETNYKGDIKIKSISVFKSDNFQYHNFLGIIDNEFTPELDWETSGYKWMTQKELIELNDKHFGLKNIIDNSLNKLI